MRALAMNLAVALPLFAGGALARAATIDDLEVKGRVVDAETGAPVEGAVVEAAWNVRHVAWAPILGSAHSGTPKIIRVAEALTDQDGRFAVAGRPEVPGGWERDALAFPLIWFFKPGYEPDRRGPGGFLTGVDAYREPLNPPKLFVPYTNEEGAVIALHRRGANEKALDKLASMASFLDGNLMFAEGLGPQGGATLDNMAAERRALLMVDAEIRKLAGRPHWWGPAQDYVRSERAKAKE